MGVSSFMQLDLAWLCITDSLSSDSSVSHVIYIYLLALFLHNLHLPTT